MQKCNIKKSQTAKLDKCKREKVDYEILEYKEQSDRATIASLRLLFCNF